jgi:Yip1 domain
MDATSTTKIAELERSGQITTAEAQRLREALGKREKRSIGSMLLDPLPALSSGTAALIAVAVAVAQVALSLRAGVRFNGALDVHVGSTGVIAPGVALADLVVAWPLTALVLWSAGRLAGGKGRLVDMASGLGVARASDLLVAIVVSVVVARSPMLLGAGQPRPALLALAFGVLPLAVWSIWLFYTAFRHASGLAGRRAGLSFTAGIIAAEVVSTVALTALRS